MQKNGVIISFFRMLISSAVVLCCAYAAAGEEELFKIKEMTPGYTGKFVWGMFTDQRQLKDLPHLKAALPQYPENHKIEVICYITPGGTGEAEGLQPGDVVLETSAYSSVTSCPGEKITMKVWRAKEKKLSPVTITLPQYYQIKYYRQLFYQLGKIQIKTEHLCKFWQKLMNINLFSVCFFFKQNVVYMANFKSALA